MTEEKRGGRKTSLSTRRAREDPQRRGMLGDVAENTAALDMELGVFPKKPLVSTYLQSILLSPVTLLVRWLGALAGSPAAPGKG